MNRQNRLILAGALAAASALLTILIYLGLQPQMVNVLVSTREIKPCSVLTEQDLTVVPVDSRMAKRLFPTAFSDPKQVAGRAVAVRRVRQDEVLSRNDSGIVAQTQLSRVGVVPSSAVLTDDQRLTRISVGRLAANSCDFIEIYRNQAGDVRPVLNRTVQVISNEGGLVTLLVSREELELLLDAQNQSPLQAVLAPVPEPTGTSS